MTETSNWLWDKLKVFVQWRDCRLKAQLERIVRNEVRQLFARLFFTTHSREPKTWLRTPEGCRPARIQLVAIAWLPVTLTGCTDWLHGLVFTDWLHGVNQLLPLTICR